MNKYDVILADLFEWLEKYDGPRFQAVLSDPPYALISIAKRFGKEGSAPAQEGVDGRFTRLSGGFMGQKWDGFQSLEHYQSWVSEWAKLLIEKALYPGAVCLFFGGTRTHHHLGVGLERGGFEIVDCLMWLHGQGFPKSHQIVEGYGTALKPAWEPIFLCRAPRGDKTFAQLAIEFGTGALNIEGSRIGLPENKRAAGTRAWKAGTSAGMTNQEGELQTAPHDGMGRWPANLILSHTDDCIKVGEYKIEGRIINRFEQGMMPFGNAEGEEYESEQMADETVERWACVPVCPVRVLDDQAGELKSGHLDRSRIQAPNRIYGQSPRNLEGIYESNSGGPSRFFYTAKASRAEKDKGVEDFHWKRTDEGFERISAEEYSQLPRRERARGCIHPTVKPLDILRHLATMILPPPGPEYRSILIPFSGSGSEMIGAAQAGWEHVTGIEFEEQYVEIAKARIRGNLGLFAGGVE